MYVTEASYTNREAQSTTTTKESAIPPYELAPTLQYQFSQLIPKSFRGPKTTSEMVGANLSLREAEYLYPHISMHL